MKKPIASLLALLMSGSALLAQTDVTNTGTLYITGGSDILYISGSFTNNNTSALTNNGNLYIRQNLTNNQSSVAVGTGTLYLNGIAAQTIGGSQPFNTFNLVTDNTAGFTLNADLRISGTHAYTNGVITTSATPNYLTYQAGSSYTGAGDGSHVNGWVKKFGNTNFDFPVGTGTYLRSISLQGLSASSEFNVRWLSPTPNPTNVAAPILLVDNNEYWNIVRVSGGNAAVYMNWDNSKVTFPPFPLAQIRVVNYTGGLWTSVGGSATGNIATTGNINSNTVSSFGLFTFGSIDWFVPIQFLQFTATRKAGYSQLDWTTAREINADHFEVERSDDGQNFRRIGLVSANGSLQTNMYQYPDRLPLNGTAWYRIRSVDKNNRVNYSSIAVVTERNTSAGLYVINNPVYQNIYISATGNYSGKYEYSIYNNAGQVVQKGNLNASTGGVFAISLNTAFAQGVYILDIRNAAHRLTQKIVVR